MSDIIPLDEAEELRLIMEAQAGSAGAMERLIDVYTPMIKKAARVHSTAHNYEDAEQEAYTAFIELVQEHDLERGNRLKGYLAARLDHEMADAISASTNAWGIPTRTVQRYYQILKAADGDVGAAADMANMYGMSNLTFLTISDMLNSVKSVDYTDGDDHDIKDTYAGPMIGGVDVADSYEEVITRLTVHEMLQDVISAEHRAIIEMAYGFEGVLTVGEDEDIHPTASSVSLAAFDDGTVAAALNWAGAFDKDWTRQTVQRRRTAQLKAWHAKYADADITKEAA